MTTIDSCFASPSRAAVNMASGKGSTHNRKMATCFESQRLPCETTKQGPPYLKRLRQIRSSEFFRSTKTASFCCHSHCIWLSHVFLLKLSVLELPVAHTLSCCPDGRSPQELPPLPTPLTQTVISPSEDHRLGVLCVMWSSNGLTRRPSHTKQMEGTLHQSFLRIG